MNRALLDLQILDTFLLSLLREKKSLDTGDSARRIRDQWTQKLESAREKLRQNHQSRVENEAQLEITEAKIARQKARLMSVSSPHEISALERDIAGMTRLRGELDELILELMDAIEISENEVAELEKSRMKAQIELERIETEFARETARLDALLQNRKATRPALENQLGEAEKERYSNAFRKHGGLAIAQIADGQCSGCGVTILPYKLQEAQIEEFPTCEGCGRILWVEKRQK